MQEKGYIHVYTGNGKGKTTAAVGLAVRALGHNLKVCIFHILKYELSGEDNFLQSHKNISIFHCCPKNNPCNSNITEQDITQIKKTFVQVKNIVNSNEFDMIILDEFSSAVYYNYIDEDDFVHLLKNKPDNLEIILTGRFVSDKVMNIADVVTEMKLVKHYFDSGVNMRKGIEW